MSPEEIIQEAIDECELILVDNQALAPIELCKSGLFTVATPSGMKKLRINKCNVERWISDDN